MRATQIIDNGVLLDDPTKALLREALAEVVKLNTKLGQRIQLLLVEIQKQHKKFVVTCDRTRWQQQKPTTAVAKCTALANILAADAVVTQSQNYAPLQAAVGSSCEVVLIGDVSESNFHATRRRLASVDQPLDQLNATDVEELVGRATKYAATIRFFDYRMVGSVQRATRYLAGIHFFVAIWERWCVVGDPNSRSVELYSVGNTNSQGGYLTGAEADTRLETRIQQPLHAAITARVSRFIKQDNEPAIFHTRGFEARSRAYTIDPGFDAVDHSGPTRRCLLKFDLAAESHFAECRKLKSLP